MMPEVGQGLNEPVNLLLLIKNTNNKNGTYYH
jgi:hypothetical protein